MREVYRFRKMCHLLDPYRELEDQTIYFACPHDLNDPMEGLRDLVWSGDRIVWTNLFKNYIYCLHWMYFLFRISSDDSALKSSDVPVFGRWDDPPTPQLEVLFDDIWSTMCDDLRLSALVSKIASVRRQVRYNELVFYLGTLHQRAIASIQKVHVLHGMQDEAEQPFHVFLTRESFLTDTSFFESLAELGESEEAFESMFGEFIQFRTELELECKYHEHRAFNKRFTRNMQFLVLDFPRIYVQQLSKLLWPDWYTACFAKDYRNSSLWATYGDSHKGACLVFGTVDSGNKNSLALNQRTGWSSNHESRVTERFDFVPMVFHDIQYSNTIGRVDFFRSIGRLPVASLMTLWYRDEEGNLSECAPDGSSAWNEDAWRESYWDTFKRDICVKTNDWAHEQECRLILHGLLEDSLDKQHRTLSYEFSSLKGVIFGINSSDEDKIRVIEVVRRKCIESERTDFKLFQAYYSPMDGRIRRYEIGIDLV